MEQNSVNNAQQPPQGQVNVNNNTQVPFQNQVQPQYQYQNPVYNTVAQPVKKKKKLFLPVFLIGIVIVIGLVIGDIFLLKHFIDARKDKKDSLQGPSSSSLTQISHDENGDFQFLSGSFDETVNSQEEALEFISKHSWDMGIKDAYAELTFVEGNKYKGISYYRFQQVLNDVPVYGNVIIVTVNTDGKVERINGTYTQVDISTTPSKTLDEAEAVAKELSGDDPRILSSELTVIPHSESGSAKLVYDISVTGSEKSVQLILDADNCEIVSENNLIAAETEVVDVNVYDTIYTVELEKNAIGGYLFSDPKRDIYVSDGRLVSFESAAVTKGILGGSSPISAIKTGENPDGSISLLAGAFGTGNFGKKLTEYSVGSLSSVQNAYDYYNYQFGWKSFDGIGGMPLRIIVEPCDSLTPQNNPTDTALDILKDLGWFVPNGETWVGAGYIKKSNVILVGAIEDVPLFGKGVLGHEYTHGVFHNIVHPKDGVEVATVNEGYADTIGSIIARDWDFSANEFPSDWDQYDYQVRSATNPTAYGNPEMVGGENYKPFTEKKVDEHLNATIISHTAYLMTQKGMFDDEVAELFFNSMFNLTPNTNFNQAAVSLLFSANSLGYSDEQKLAVREAMFETKLFTPEGKTSIYVHSGNKALAKSTIMINGNKVGQTDKDGKLVLDFDPKWFGEVKIKAKHDGYDSVTQNIIYAGNRLELDFDLSRTDPNRKYEGRVKVTILDMTEPESREKAKVYYLDKGSKIDLNDLVGKLKVFGVKTDGTKLYFENEHVPVDLSYRIYGTRETFDFDEPILEDVVIEPIVGIGEDGFTFQDFKDIKEGLEGLFDIENYTITEE